VGNASATSEETHFFGDLQLGLRLLVPSKTVCDYSPHREPCVGRSL